MDTNLLLLKQAIVNYLNIRDTELSIEYFNYTLHIVFPLQLNLDEKLKYINTLLVYTKIEYENNLYTNTTTLKISLLNLSPFNIQQIITTLNLLMKI